MRILLDVFIIVVLGVTAIILYQNYWDDIRSTLFHTEVKYTIYLASTALSVTVADSQEERIKGLSGTPMLHDFEGKLFIFDTDDKFGFWMKDMLIPIDMIWINKNLEVVYIQEDVSPSTYPEVFAPSENARFVLETNSHLVSSLKVKVGDRIVLPPTLFADRYQKKLATIGLLLHNTKTQMIAQSYFLWLCL